MKFFPGAKDTTVWVYAEPVHWDGNDGKPGTPEWKSIDLEVKPKPWLRRLGSDKPWEITAGPWTAELSGDRPENYRLTAGEAWIEFAALHDTAGVTAKVVPSAAGLKETLVLRDEKAGPLAWRVSASGALRLEKGAVEVGGSAIRVSAPVAWDAKKAPVGVTVSMEGDVLRYALEASGVAWPVTVDPSATVNQERQSGYTEGISAVSFATARDLNVANDYGVWNPIYAGTSGYGTVEAPAEGNYRNFRSLLRFTPPPMYGCEACTLFVNGSQDASTYDDSLYVVGSFWGTTIENSDYIAFPGRNTGGNHTSSKLTYGWQMSGYSSGWNGMVFTPAGRDSIRNHGENGVDIELMILSYTDYYVSGPGWAINNFSYIRFESSGNVPYLSITYTGKSVNSPTGFRLTPVPGEYDTLTAAWTNNHSGSITSLKLGRINSPGDTTWTTMATVATNSAGIGGLNPYQKYTYVVKADSAGYAACSSPDDMWTSTELSRVEELVDDDHGVFPTNAADYATARGETDAGDLTDRSYPIYAIGQSDGQSGEHGRVNRVALTWLPLTAADLLNPVRACTTSVFVNQDSTATDFTVRMYKGAWRGLGSIEALWYQFLGWVSGTSPYTGTTLIGDVSTSGIAAGYLKLPYTANGLDVLNAEIAAGDSVKRSLLSSRDISATSPGGNEFFNVNGNDYTTLILYQALPDTAAGGVALTALTTASMRVTWDDRAHSERGYIVVDASTGAAVSDTVAANGETVDIAGLEVNTEYSWKVKTLGGDGHGDLSDAATEYTLANVPGMITQTFPAGTLMKFVLAVNGNPTWTPFAIQDSLSGLYIQSAAGVCTWGASPDWKTYAQWGGVLGDTAAVLVGKKYVPRAKAKSGN
jgi:hypothetical protein